MVGGDSWTYSVSQGWKQSSDKVATTEFLLDGNEHRFVVVVLLVVVVVIVGLGVEDEDDVS